MRVFFTLEAFPPPLQSNCHTALHFKERVGEKEGKKGGKGRKKGEKEKTSLKTPKNFRCAHPDPPRLAALPGSSS